MPALTLPHANMTAQWPVGLMLGYMRTWSAAKRYKKSEGRDPLADHEAELRRAWRNGVQSVNWPLTVKAWRR